MEMQENYYILQSGRLKREGNTLYFIKENFKKPLPIKNINSIYVFGEIDLNTKLLNFLAPQ